MPERRRVIIEVRITDPLRAGKILGEAASQVELRDDLLTSSFASAAQDWFSQMVSALGTMAYMDAFPRAETIKVVHDPLWIDKILDESPPE
jgi:hypothetical protein